MADKTMKKNKIPNKLLYAIGEFEDGTVGLTIFEDGNSATVYLTDDILNRLIVNLSLYHLYFTNLASPEGRSGIYPGCCMVSVKNSSSGAGLAK